MRRHGHYRPVDMRNRQLVAHSGSVSDGEPSRRSGYRGKLLPRAAPASGAPSVSGPKETTPSVVRPAGLPRSTQAAPLELWAPSSSGAPAEGAAPPSPPVAASWTAAPKRSPASATPGTPAVSWVNAWAPVPDRPPEPPYSWTTLPASF